MKTAIPLLLLALMIAVPARAEETMFYCYTEAAAEAVGAKIVISQAEADKVGEPLIALGVCVYLQGDVRVTITHRGKVFGKGARRVEVVGFKHPTGVMVYGLFPRENEI